LQQGSWVPLLGGYQILKPFRQLLIAKAPSEDEPVFGALSVQFSIGYPGNAFEALSPSKVSDSGVFSLVASQADKPTN
jgi:hypothetical protein